MRNLHSNELALKHFPPNLIAVTWESSSSDSFCLAFRLISGEIDLRGYTPGGESAPERKISFTLKLFLKALQILLGIPNISFSHPLFSFHVQKNTSLNLDFIAPMWFMLLICIQILCSIVYELFKHYVKWPHNIKCLVYSQFQLFHSACCCCC